MHLRRKNIQIIVGILFLLLCLISAYCYYQYDRKSSDRQSESKTLNQVFFRNGDKSVENKIIKNPKEQIQYDDYDFVLQSYVYDEKLKAGYIKISVSNEKMKTKEMGNDLMLEFGMESGFEVRVDDNTLAQATSNYEYTDKTLNLFYQLDEFDGKISIWDIKENKYAAEYVLENTCNEHRELEIDDDTQILISQIGFQIITKNEISDFENLSEDEKIKTLQNQNKVNTIELVYSNGDNIFVVGKKAASRTSISINEDKIFQTIMIEENIQFEKLQAIRINEKEFIVK